MGKVDFGGVARELCMDLLPEVEVGSWVLAHAGFAIQQLDEEEAQKTLALFREWMEFEGEAAIGPTIKDQPDGGGDAPA